MIIDIYRLLTAETCFKPLNYSQETYGCILAQT